MRIAWNAASPFAKKLVHILESHGFKQVRQSGSHAIFRDPDGRGTTVPIHGNFDVVRGLLRQIMRDASLTLKDLVE